MIKLKNFYGRCRLCLGESKMMISIFHDDPTSQVRRCQKIMQFAHIKIEYGDGLPTVICPSCYVFLENWFSFKEQCAKVDTLLRQQLALLQLQRESVPQHSPDFHLLTRSSNEYFEDEAISFSNCESSLIKNKREINNGEALYDFCGSEINNEDTHQIVSHQESELSNCVDGRSITSECSDLLQKVLLSYSASAKEKKDQNIHTSDDTEIPNYLNKEKEYCEVKYNNDDTQGNYICPHCKRNCLDQDDLNCHNCSHLGGVSSCDLCKLNGLVDEVQEKSNSSLDNLEHLSCSLCKKVFSTRYKLRVHLRYHGKEESIPCPICKKYFRTKMFLNKHMVAHREKTIMCKLCPAKFKSNTQLKQHYYSHSTTRDHICTICSKGFKSRQHLRCHMKGHAGDLYRCEVCAKTFNSRYSMIIHLQLHNSKRPYSCPHCEKAFKSMNNLRGHVSKRHRKRTVTCQICFKQYDYFYLKQHMRYHTGRFTCPLCKKPFGTNYKLQRHMLSKIHTNSRKCTIKTSDEDHKDN